MIRLENVSLYGFLEGVSLSVPARRRAALRGDSRQAGALLRLAAGMSRPDSGTVWAAGEEVSAMTADEAAAFRAGNVGYAHREPVFLEELTLAENGAMPLMIQGAAAGPAIDAAAEALEAAGLAHAMHARPGGLSLPERRMAAVVRALITGPALVLLDDVFTGLGREMSRRLGAVIDRAYLARPFTLLAYTAGAAEGLETDMTIQLGREL